MKFGIRISVSDNNVQPAKMNVVNELSNKLRFHFDNCNYGEDVERIDIGLLLVLERPEYENWYKPKKVKYIKYKKSTNLAGEIIIIEKTLSYEIKLSDEQLYKFTGGDDELSKEVLATEIIKSLLIFDKLPKEIKQFDVERFKVDLYKYLESLN